MSWLQNSGKAIDLSKIEYNPYSEVYYGHKMDAYISEDCVDKVIKILNLDPKNEAGKKSLWHDLGTAIMFANRPPPEAAQTTPRKVHQYTQKLLKTLIKAEAELQRLHYNNHSYDSPENIVGEALRQESCVKAPSSIGVRARYSDGRGIYEAQNKKQENVQLYPFDKELDGIIAGLGTIISSLAPIELAFKKISPQKGKAGSTISDDIIINLCRLYKKFTGKIPRSSSTGGSPSGRKITGTIISYLQTILPLTSYTRKNSGEKNKEALHKALERIRTTGKAPDLWTDI